MRAIDVEAHGAINCRMAKTTITTMVLPPQQYRRHGDTSTPGESPIRRLHARACSEMSYYTQLAQMSFRKKWISQPVCLFLRTCFLQESHKNRGFFFVATHAMFKTLYKYHTCDTWISRTTYQSVAKYKGFCFSILMYIQ